MTRPDAELPAPLRGVIPPLATPLIDTDTLDADGLERLIEHTLAGGVSGLFVMGTTGEGPSLGYDLRRELIAQTCRITAGRAPVLVGVTDPSLNESVSLAVHAAQCGAAGIVVAPPFYFHASQADLLQYIECLAGRSPLPIFLYNIPGCTKVPFAPETVRAAADIPGVVGIKDSCGDIENFRQLTELLADRPDFTLIMGPDKLTGQAVMMGAHGAVNGGSNMFPEHYVALYEAARAGDQETVDRLQKKVVQIYDTIYHAIDDPSCYVKSVKCSLACLGICTDEMAQPLQKFSPADRQIIAENLKKLM
ncbi:MAG: dihydrodipicolinate synthase family protein [Phycisphaerales bacterium]|jgi:dihydrodipicolinate synthase/N-acetylneuraminate lyase|nr:dihydrodipicolinate synthase family protein [Phycisphaerales bacterium]